jgi:hypothetical protein
MTSTFTIDCSVHFPGRGRGSRKKPPRDSRAELVQVPRVSRLMALAIRFDELVRVDEVNYTELASLGRVTRARMSQIMSLLCLAPDLQEEILFLLRTPQAPQGRDPIRLRDLLPIAVVPDWRKQRVRWKELMS